MKYPNRTKEWLDSLNLKADLKEGDMLKLPYTDEKFDCILCRNVISHQDTEGVKQILKEINKDAKMGMDSLNIVTDKVQDEKFKKLLNEQHNEYQNIYDRTQELLVKNNLQM